MGHSQVASPPIKLSLALLLLFAISLLALNMRWLLAEAYGTVAVEGLQSERRDASTIKTAELAVKLSPYAGYWRAVHARSLVREERREALEQYRQAVRIAPANASLWQSFVRFKLGISEYDSELEHAMRRVSELAPRNLALHYDNALLAMSYWNWGSSGMRILWANSVRYVVKTDPKWFLWSVTLNRQEEILCHQPGLEMTETAEWCKLALVTREACYGPRPRPQVAAWCRRVGMLEDAPK